LNRSNQHRGGRPVRFGKRQYPFRKGEEGGEEGGRILFTPAKKKKSLTSTVCLTMREKKRGVKRDFSAHCKKGKGQKRRVPGGRKKKGSAVTGRKKRTVRGGGRNAQCGHRSIMGGIRACNQKERKGIRDRRHRKGKKGGWPPEAALIPGKKTVDAKPALKSKEKLGMNHRKKERSAETFLAFWKGGERACCLREK